MADGGETDERATVEHTEAADELRVRLRGTVFTSTDDGYDAARAIWNGMIDKRPAIIARCFGPADVGTCVRVAREHGLEVSIRGGGHNVAGHALTDKGVVIDLSGMRGVHVDPENRIIRAQAGLTLGDLDHESQAFGLVVPAGVVSTTGIAGLTLGGGFGYTSRRFGLTCDNLIAADVVTAGGDFVRATESEDADLLWGLRGGGGNFGVVTSFEYRAHPLGPTVLAGVLVHPIDRARDFLHFYGEFAREAPDEVGSLVALRLAPPAPFIPDDLHGKPVVVVFLCYSGEVEDGERVLQPLRTFGPPAADVVRPQPFVAHQAQLDPMQPPGRDYYWKSHDLTALSDGVIETLIAAAETITSPHSIIALFHLAGQIARVDEDASAYSHRAAAFALNINAGWDDGNPDAHMAWTRATSSAIEPEAHGVYVNFLGDEGDQRARDAYERDKYSSLVRLKNRYDPTNVFHVNQNIRPSEQ